MIKFSYGISDFKQIRHGNYLYLDRTQSIPDLEQAGRQLIFLRPRRFGKSLLLSMLSSYYDLNAADQFETLFSGLAIAKQPTTECNQLMILQWDFSEISAQGNIEQIKASLFAHINQTIKSFQRRYTTQLPFEIDLYPDDAIASFQSLANVVQDSGHQLYLLIDEYDNFANEVLMYHIHDEQRHHDLLQGEGILKTLFKVIKASASQGKLSRVFIVGVSPMVLSDITSGYNVATSIYLDDEFNQLCGVTEAELTQLVQQVVSADHLADKVLSMMRQFYNGYRFCYNLDAETLYNPTLCFYFLRHYQKYDQAPYNILDANLAMDAKRIQYIASLPNGAAVIEQVLDEKNPLALMHLENQFGVENLQRLQEDPNFMVSLLYYFGILTITGKGVLDELLLSAPNLVVRGLYVEELKQKTLPALEEKRQSLTLAKQFYQDANLQPLAEFIENKYFAVLDNRDYRWSNELTIKTAFLSLLFNDTYYVMDSETSLQRGYSDLIMIIRLNMRHLKSLHDFAFEFKYLKRKHIGLSAKQIKTKSLKALYQLPVVNQALDDALTQLQDYKQVLADTYQQPERLCCLAVVSLGFDRIVWKRLEDKKEG